MLGMQTFLYNNSYFFFYDILLFWPQFAIHYICILNGDLLTSNWFSD